MNGLYALLIIAAVLVIVPGAIAFAITSRTFYRIDRYFEARDERNRRK